MPYKNKEDLYANQIQRWIKRKKKAIEYLGGVCVICGYNGFYGAYHFHHLDPQQKKWQWTKLRLRKWSDVKDELDKCVLLCATCHSEVHGGYSSIH